VNGKCPECGIDYECPECGINYSEVAWSHDCATCVERATRYAIDEPVGGGDEESEDNL
jgi:hypothetical protein